MLLYAQVSCAQSKETLMNKRIWGVVLVCIGMIIAFSYRHSMLYYKNMDICNERLYDTMMISAEDFSICIKITEKMIEAFETDYNSK